MTKKTFSIKRVRGTRDIIGHSARIQHFIIDTMKTVVQRYNFHEIILPLIESTSLFTRSLGDGSDIVSKEMYTFPDNSGNSLSLRPEGTAGCIRAVVENRLLVNNLPQKLFYSGNMYRYERPQRGRYREFQQFGVESIGSSEPNVDVEVISMGYGVLQSLGVHDKVELHINTLGDVESRQKYEFALKAHFTKYENDLSDDSKRRLSNGNILRILDSKSPMDELIISSSPMFLDYITAASLHRFEDVLNGLQALDIEYIWDQRLVRGLDYYAHTAFEYLEKSVEDNSNKPGLAVLAGGRYDKLVEDLGGPNRSSIGWAAGIDRLSLLVEPSMIASNQLIAMIPVTQGDSNDAKILAKAMKTAEMLRKSHWNIHFCHGHATMKKKMKEAAEHFRCDVALILGENENFENKITVRNLSTRNQETIPISNLEEVLKDLRHQR